MSRPPLSLTSLTLVVAVVGVIDAARGRVWDLLVILLLICCLQIAVVVAMAGDRTKVSVRPDLARWAAERSQRTGEPVNDVIDRSLATFRHGLYGADQNRGH